MTSRGDIHDHGGCLFPLTINKQKEANKQKNCELLDQKSLFSVRMSCHRNRSVSESPDRSDDPQADGEDEVDNIMSKHAPTTCFKATQQEKTYLNRRPSLSPYTSSDDTEDDSVLAKSLPTTLPSYSNYRDGDDFRSKIQLQNKQNIVRTSQQFNTSDHIRSDQIYSPLNKSYDEHLRVETVMQRENAKKRRNVHVQKNSRSTVKCYLLFIPIMLTIGLATFYQYYYETESDQYNEHKFVYDLKHLENKYRISVGSILQVETGILTISENKDTGSFIFLGDSKSSNFNGDVFNNFINDVAITAVKYLRNESRVAQHLIIDSSSLDLEDHHDFLYKYRDEVDRNGVMLVRELDRVPSSLAMAFHYYCDEYSPFVNKSAIFFTLDLANCSNKSGSKSVHSHVENCLKNKWRDGVPQANIGPLLSRVVNVIIDLRQT